jgi:hypothetical protein
MISAKCRPSRLLKEGMGTMGSQYYQNIQINQLAGKIL